jgi:hypothetical protein
VVVALVLGEVDTLVILDGLELRVGVVVPLPGRALD